MTSLSLKSHSWSAEVGPGRPYAAQGLLRRRQHLKVRKTGLGKSSAHLHWQHLQYLLGARSHMCSERELPGARQAERTTVCCVREVTQMGRSEPELPGVEASWWSSGVSNRDLGKITGCNWGKRCSERRRQIHLTHRQAVHQAFTRHSFSLLFF